MVGSLLDLQPEDAPGGAVTITVSGVNARGQPATVRREVYPGSHRDFLDLHLALSRTFGLRTPESTKPVTCSPDPAVRAVLTESLSPDVLYGYGDPAVSRVQNGDGTATWWLYVTSNDAPDAFPILRSTDLETWRHESFVFPEGCAPDWALTGPGSDFWAPELHRVGDAFWLCFTARTRAGELAIGLAHATSPGGPFAPAPEPLLQGGVIDPHIIIDPDGASYLVWKEDANDRWPPLIARMLGLDPGVGERLFPAPADLRSVDLCSRLWALRRSAVPMETFFILQPLIEAAAENFLLFRQRLGRLSQDPALGPDLRSLAEETLVATRTVIRAQRLLQDGSALTGDSIVILENDQPWEAHLIEGPWISRIGDRYVLLYAGNDFSTARYGIGVATASHPLGPYSKASAPLLGSTTAWTAPGHPSVTVDPHGRPRMFMHGFKPGQVGYKAFRALLTAPLVCEHGEIRLGD